MKYDERSLPAILDRSFARFRILPHQEVQGACDRVLSRLRNEVERDPAAVVPIRLVAPSRLRWRRLAIAAAAAVVILAVLSVRQRTGQNATVEMAEGQAYKTGADSGAMLSLPDNSRVEMRSQSDLALERADDGLRIQLSKGSVIVNAPARRAGQLYVRTKDLTVAITGTVFLVDAEEAGSRVAVIQGNVRVQHGAMETNLTQNEQLVSNPSMKSAPVSEEIAWSQNIDIHLDQLQQSRKTIEERCGASDMRTVWHDNGGFNLRLPLTIWRNYKCQHERDAQMRTRPSEN
jgi:ferric-dicitrate binding protein FerR (iron transport regulator)